MINEGTSLIEREGILTSAEELVMFIEGPAGLGRSLGEVEKALVASIYADAIESGADVDSIVDLLVSNFPESANLSDQGLPVPAMPGQMYAVDSGPMGFSSGYMSASKFNIPIKLAAPPFIGDAPPPPWVKPKKPKKQRTERELKRSFENATELNDTSDLIDAYDLFLQELQTFSKLFSYIEDNRAIPDLSIQVQWEPSSTTFAITDENTGEQYYDHADFASAQDFLDWGMHQSPAASSEMLNNVMNSDDGEMSISGGGSKLDVHYIQTRLQERLDALSAAAPEGLSGTFSALTDKIQNYDNYVALVDAFADLEPTAAATDLSNITTVRNHAAALGLTDAMKPYLDFMTAWGIALQFIENPETSATGSMQLDFSPEDATFSIINVDTGSSEGSNLSFEDAYNILTMDNRMTDDEAQIYLQEASEMGTVSIGMDIQEHELASLEKAVADAAGGDIDPSAGMIMQAVYYSDPDLLQMAEARASEMHAALASNEAIENEDGSTLATIGNHLAQGISADVNQLSGEASNKLRAAMQKVQEMMNKIREEEATPKEEEVARASRWPTDVPAWASSWNRIQRNMPVNVTLRATTFWPDSEGNTQAPSYKSPLFDLDPDASVVLDRAALSPQIAQEFNANNIRISNASIIEVEAPGRLWRLTDGPNSYIIERDESGVRVYEPGKLQPPTLGKTPGTKQQSDKTFWDEWLKTTSDYFSWLLTPGTNPKGEPTQHQWGIGDLSSERGSGRYIADWLRQNASYSDEDIANISPPLPKKRKRNLKKKDADEPEFSDPFRPWSAY